MCKQKLTLTYNINCKQNYMDKHSKYLYKLNVETKFTIKLLEISVNFLSVSS